MPHFRDQLNRSIELDQLPKRIISTVPSQTELLFDLGLNDEVIGITKFCVHPNEQWKSKERIGGTKSLDLEKIVALQPDLIIANKEENTQEQIEQLATQFPVWISDVLDLNDAFTMLTQVGELVGKDKAAASLRTKAETEWEKIKHIAQPIDIAYCIWNEPLMFAGKETFIHAVLTWLGFQNVAANKKGRYPELNVDQLNELNPEVVFLSSEPFPFREKHQIEFHQQAANIQRRFPLVDGEMFSWYGSRLIPAAAYLNQLLEELNLKTS